MSTNIPTNFKGDNTQSFENHFLRVDLIKTEDEGEVSRVDFISGCIKKTYINPVFPIFVDLDECETEKLNNVNIGYLVAYDKQDRPKVCQGSIRFTFKNGVFCKC